MYMRVDMVVLLSMRHAYGYFQLTLWLIEDLSVIYIIIWYWMLA